MHHWGTKHLLLDQMAWDIFETTRPWGNGHITFICSNNQMGFWCYFPELSSAAPASPSTAVAAVTHLTFVKPGTSWCPQGRFTVLRLFQCKFLYLHVLAASPGEMLSWFQWRKYQSRSQGLGPLSQQVKTESLQKHLYTFLCLSFLLLK